MTPTPTPPVDPLAYEKERFSRLAQQHISGESALRAGIGTLNEKLLHAVLKDYMSEEGAQQEVRLSDAMLIGSPSARDMRQRARDADRYVADVLSADGEIIEIQTGSFYPLIPKLDFYLRRTALRVTVVHPLLHKKWVRRLHRETGTLSPRRRSPKREQVIHLARELYWLAPYLAEPRFSLQLELLEVEEIRTESVVRRGRTRSERVECLPLALLDEVVLACPEDYAAYFLPPPAQLADPLSAAEYASATGIRGRAVYGMLGILSDLGFLQPIEPPAGTRGKRWVRTPAAAALQPENDIFPGRDLG